MSIRFSIFAVFFLLFIHVYLVSNAMLLLFLLLNLLQLSSQCLRAMFPIMHNIGLSSNCIDILLHLTIPLFAFYLLFVYSSKHTVGTITILCCILGIFGRNAFNFRSFHPYSFHPMNFRLLFLSFFFHVYVQCTVCSQFLNHKPVFCYRIDHISMLYLTIGMMVSYVMLMRYIIESGMFRPNM